MAAQGGQLRIEVYVGNGEPSGMDVQAGQVLGPMSMGTAGDWRVQAQGVRPVHGYVYSNGVDVFLRSESASQPILANGQAVPTDQWMPVRPPCEIKVGVARLWFGEATAAPAAAPKPPDPGPIIIEDSTQDRRGPPSRTEILTLQDVPPVPTVQPMSNRKPLPALRPAAGMPADLAPAAGAPPGGAAAEPERPEAPGRPDADAATRAIPIEDLLAQQAAKHSRAPGASNPPGTPGFSMGLPGGPPGPGFNLPPSSPGFGPPPAGISSPGFGAPPAGTSSPGFGAPPGAPGFGPPPAPGSAPGFGAPPVMGAEKPGAGPSAASGSKLAVIKAKWKEATPVQKILVALMLPLLGAVLIIFSDDPPPPKPAPGKKPAATAAPTATAMPTGTATAAPTADATDAGAPPDPGDGGAQAEPTATVMPTATAAPRATEPALPPGKKTLQRQAVDAVAAGSFEEAAKLYDELAKAHPEVPAYAEAARILRAKAAKPQ